MFGSKWQLKAVRPVRWKDRDLEPGEVVNVTAQEYAVWKNNRRFAPVKPPPEPPAGPPVDLKPEVRHPRFDVVLSHGCAIAGQSFSAGDTASVTVEEMKLLDGAGRLQRTPETDRILG